MQIGDYHMHHKGETALVVGVGPNLGLTPPALFPYPSFGVNTIYKYPGWKPTYYVGVDERLKLEDGQAVCRAYREIPKWFPRPDWDDLHGDNIYRFAHRTGDIGIGGYPATHRDAILRWGIAYYRIMDAVFQLGMWMGFTTFLLIGVQHNPADDRAHFWGEDVKSIAGQPFDWWFEGYKHFAHLPGIRVLNISADTYVPEDVLPRDDWHKWAKL